MKYIITKQIVNTLDVSTSLIMNTFSLKKHSLTDFLYQTRRMRAKLRQSFLELIDKSYQRF